METKDAIKPTMFASYSLEQPYKISKRDSSRVLGYSQWDMQAIERLRRIKMTCVPYFEVQAQDKKKIALQEAALFRSVIFGIC